MGNLLCRVSCSCFDLKDLNSFFPLPSLRHSDWTKASDQIIYMKVSHVFSCTLNSICLSCMTQLSRPPKGSCTSLCKYNHASQRAVLQLLISPPSDCFPLCVNVAEILPAVWFLPRLCRSRAGPSAARTSAAASSSWCCAASSATPPSEPPRGGSGRLGGTILATPRSSPCSLTWLMTHTQHTAYFLGLYTSSWKQRILFVLIYLPFVLLFVF